MAVGILCKFYLLLFPRFVPFAILQCAGMHSYCMKTIQIYSLLKKGALHPVYCEDFQIAIQLDDDFSVFAVMDGCTSGTDSHFASALTGKILNKASKLVYHPNVWPQIGMKDIPKPKGAKGLASFLLYFLFEEMRRTRNEMILDVDEMLSTVLLLVYDRKQDQAFITAKGDGFVSINGEVHTIDEYNAPRYPAMYLDRPYAEWVEMQQYDFWVQAPRDLSISTDGVESYLLPNLKPDEQTDSVKLMLSEDLTGEKEDVLERRHKVLKSKSLRPIDDVSIIRLQFLPTIGQN